MEKRGTKEGVCKEAKTTEWDEWGLIPKDHPRFRGMMELQMTKAKGKQLQPGYIDYLMAVSSLAVKKELEVHLMVPGPIGALPQAVGLTFIPLPGSECAEYGKPSITMLCTLEYARPCWGTKADCVCGGVPYIMDCNHTALRWRSKVYALRLVKCYGNTRKPRHMVHVLGNTLDQCLDQLLAPPSARAH